MSTNHSLSKVSDSLSGHPADDLIGQVAGETSGKNFGENFQEFGWTAPEIKNLRSRLGWSQAEFARRMKTPLATISGWELGSLEIEEQHHSLISSIEGEADTCAERVHRRPLAEVMMRDRNLSQIHDFEVLSSLSDKIDETPGDKTNI